jgi:hypothetical protein
VLRLFSSLAAGFVLFGLLALAVDRSLGSTTPAPRRPAASAATRPLATSTPGIFINTKPPPNDCELFAGAITIPPGAGVDSGQGLVFAVLSGSDKTKFVWDVPPAQKERLQALLNGCIVLERGVSPQIDWP